jgi:hypothetical protein
LAAQQFLIKALSFPRTKLGAFIIKSSPISGWVLPWFKKARIASLYLKSSEGPII